MKPNPFYQGRSDRLSKFITTRFSKHSSQGCVAEEDHENKIRRSHQKVIDLESSPTEEEEAGKGCRVMEIASSCSLASTLAPIHPRSSPSYIDDQIQSLLFQKLPTEVRLMLFTRALTLPSNFLHFFQDQKGRVHHACIGLFIPGRSSYGRQFVGIDSWKQYRMSKHRSKTDSCKLNLLLTCRRVYGNYPLNHKAVLLLTIPWQILGKHTYPLLRQYL